MYVSDDELELQHRRPIQPLPGSIFEQDGNLNKILTRPLPEVKRAVREGKTPLRLGVADAITS